MSRCTQWVDFPVLKFFFLHEAGSAWKHPGVLVSRDLQRVSPWKLLFREICEIMRSKFSLILFSGE